MPTFTNITVSQYNTYIGTYGSTLTNCTIADGSSNAANLIDLTHLAATNSASFTGCTVSQYNSFITTFGTKLYNCTISNGASGAAT